MLAACLDRADVVKPLVAAGASLELKDDDGIETTHIHPDLIEEGAQETIDYMNARVGCTALLIAAASGHQNVVRELINAGASVDARDSLGLTAKSAANKEGHRRVLQALQKSPASPRKRSTRKKRR